MRSRFSLFLLCCFLTILSCNDGDIITVELDFEDTFESCQESQLLFFKTKEDPSESLSLLFSSLDYEELFEISEDSLRFIGDTLILDETATLNYRTYNRVELPDDIFCSIVPPANLNTVIDQEDPVNVTITRILTEDDNDGVPSALEGPIDPLGDDDGDGVYNFLDDDPNNASIGNANGEIETGFDTDNDGLPNFIDADDDGDNVLTRNEKPDPDGNENLSDAQDTDEDGTPDYLDDDDDGDNVLTIDEENDTQDENPLNDVTNSDAGADYLNPNVNTSVPAKAYRQHTISQTFSIRVIVDDISFDFLSQEILNFGTLSSISNSDFSLTATRTATPNFP